MLDAFKIKISTAFKVKLFGKLPSFIGWEILLDGTSIQIAQQSYIKPLLKKYKIDTCDATSAQISTTANLLPAQREEK